MRETDVCWHTSVTCQSGLQWKHKAELSSRLWTVQVMTSFKLRVDNERPTCTLSYINQWSSPLAAQGADISSSQHQEMILWLGDMNRLFQFCPETFALGVCVLNRLLSTVKVQRLIMVSSQCSVYKMSHYWKPAQMAAYYSHANHLFLFLLHFLVPKITLQDCIQYNNWLNLYFTSHCSLHWAARECLLSEMITSQIHLVTVLHSEIFLLLKN